MESKNKSNYQPVANNGGNNDQASLKNPLCFLPWFCPFSEWCCHQCYQFRHLETHHNDPRDRSDRDKEVFPAAFVKVSPKCLLMEV